MSKNTARMKIIIKDMKLENVKISSLSPLQGKLKILTDNNYEKLKRSFNKKGMFLPMFAWKRGEDDYAIMDGHGRDRMFGKEDPLFVDENGQETDSIPCLVIQADDVIDAKEKILIIASQFQRITQEGLDEFGADLDDKWIKEMTNFDAIFDYDAANDPEDEYKGMPDYKADDIQSFRRIIIHFKDQEAVETFAKLIKQKMTDKTKYIWYPEIEIDHVADKAYVEK